jgi:hypothetical protein
MKWLIYGSVLVFSTIGAYIPSIWHAGMFSIWGIVSTIVGTAIGIWAAIKINDYVDV